jgi:hypothetical protein
MGKAARSALGLCGLLIILSCIACAPNQAPLIYLLDPNPAREELPLIKEQVGQMQGVSIDEITDIGPDDEHNIYLTLAIEGKGRITLYNATLKSFTGGGPIIFVRIGDCEVHPLYLENLDRFYPDLHFNTVSEAVENYARIYERLRQNAHHDRDARMPGCWR